MDTSNKVLDNEVMEFFLKLKRLIYTEHDWYVFLCQFKVSVITNYIDRHVIYEDKLRSNLANIKNNRLLKNFQEDILPYIEDITNENRKQKLKNKYNGNRRNKKQQLRKEKISSLLQVK